MRGQSLPISVPDTARILGRDRAPWENELPCKARVCKRHDLVAHDDIAGPSPSKPSISAFSKHADRWLQTEYENLKTSISHPLYWTPFKAGEPARKGGSITWSGYHLVGVSLSNPEKKYLATRTESGSHSFPTSIFLRTHRSSLWSHQWLIPLQKLSSSMLRPKRCWSPTVPWSFRPRRHESWSPTATTEHRDLFRLSNGGGSFEDIKWI